MFRQGGLSPGLFSCDGYLPSPLDHYLLAEMVSYFYCDNLYLSRLKTLTSMLIID